VILIGIVISAGSLSAKAIAEKVDTFHFPSLMLILGSVVLFGLLLNPLGLIASLFVLVAISSYASHEFSYKATLINAVVLIVICLIVFVWALKLRFQIWPSFIGN
ncbi:MAG: tripartite tricarboxylate transporter TctB family protein, partial [Pseudomonadota bacterium]